MPLPYGQVKDLYDQLHEAGAVTQTLPEWSQQMGDLTGTDAYSEGLHDNIIRRTSHGIDKLLDAWGVNDVTGAAGRAVGGVFGMGDAGEAAGRGFTRGLLDFAPYAAATALAPETGGGSLVALGALGTGALSGAHTYADTGSVSAGVTSGITNAILPSVAGKASQFALGRLGAQYLDQPITNALGRVVTPNAYLPESVSLGRQLLAEGAGHVAAAGTLGAGDIAREALDPNEKVQNPFTSEFALQMGLQTLPFSLLHAGGKLLGHGPAYDAGALDQNIAATRDVLAKQQAQRQAEQAPPVTQNPNPQTYSESDLAILKEAHDTIDSLKQRNGRIVELRQEISDAPADADPDDLAAKHDELQALQQANVDETKGVGTLDGQLIDPPDDVTHVPLVGTDYVKSQNGKSASFTVADHPLNADNGAYETGDRVNYSTVYEHAGAPVDNGDGTVTVQLPVGYHQPIEDNRTVTQPAETPVVGTPDLPAQDNPLTPERQEADQKLAQAQDLLNQASISKDPDVFHQAKVVFNQAREAAGFSPVDDATLAEWQQMQQTDAEKATLGKMTQTMTAIERREQLEADRKTALEETKARVLGLKPDSVGVDEKFDDFDAYLADRLATFKGGNRPDLFWDVVDKWDKGDGKPGNERKGGTERLDNLLAEKARSKVKEKAPEKVIVAAQTPEAATQHVRTEMQAHAKLIFDGYAPVFNEEQLEDAREWLDAIEKGKKVSPKLADKEHIIDLNNGLIASMKEAKNSLKRAPQVNSPVSLQVNRTTFDGQTTEEGHPDTGTFYYVGDNNEPGRINKTLQLDNPLRLTQQADAGHEDGVFGDKRDFIKQLTGKDTGSIGHLEQDKILADYARSKGHDGILYTIEKGDDWDSDGWQEAVDLKNNKVSSPQRVEPQDEATILEDVARSPQAADYRPTSEQEQAVIERHGLNKTGVEVMQSLTGDPLLGGLAKDLLKRFSNTLQRVVPSVLDSSDPSSARMARNNVMQLAFSRGILGMNDTNRNFELMHELIHGLTEHALDDEKNAAVVGQLDQLRQRLIAALPKDQRAIFDNLVRTNWYDRWSQGGGRAAFSGLGPDARSAMKLYGLLNNSELLAQGFSSSDMQQYMMSVKGTKGVAGWMQFTNFVKDLLGLGNRISGTAFDEFMNYSSRLMGAGEQVSQAHNFLDGFYRNQGVGEADAQRQTTRALGVVAGSGWDATKDGILDTLTQRQVVPTADVIAAQRAVYKGLNTGSPDLPVAKSVMGELGYVADVRRVDDMLEEHLRGGADIRDALRLLPDSVTDYIYAKVNDFRQVIDGASAAAAKVNEGLLNVSHPEEIRQPLDSISKTLADLQLVQQEAKEAVATVQALTATSPDGYLAATLRAPIAPSAEGPMKTAADFVEPTSAKLWKGFVNFTQQMGQLAKTNPETAELINLGFRMKPAARWMANQMMRPFALDPRDPTADFTKDTKERISQVFRDKKMLAAVNNWIYQNQKIGGDAVTKVSIEHPDVARGLQGLTDTQKNLVENAVIMHGAMKQIAGNAILNKMANIAAWDATGILSENGQKVSDNFKLTSGLFRNIAMTDWNDPQAAAIAQQQIGAVQSNMTPEQFGELTKYMQAEVTKWQAHRDFFTQNSDWATAKRYGKFLVEYMDNGKRVQAGVDSKKEADVLTRGKQVLDFKSNVKEGVDDDFIPSIGMNAGLRQRVADAQATADAILQSKLSPEAFEQYQKYNPATQLLTEAQGSGIPDNQVGYARTRQLSKGAENLPWLENQFKWVQNTASYWSRSEFRAQARGMLNDPEIVSNPDIRSRLATHVDNMLTPDPETAQQMTKFVSTWALGFRPSTAIVTASHSIIRHTAELTRLTGKPIDSFNRMRKAMGEIVNTVTGGEQNPEHQWLMKEADKYGERENGWFDDENSNQEKVVLNFLDDVKGEKPRTLGQQLGAAGGTYSRVGMWMFQQARRVNEEAALYASYDYYREQGLSQVEARDKAFEFNHAVNTVGGTAQRPAGLFQAGVPRTAAMAAYSLKSYVVGTIGQLGRYIMEGSPWAHEELTPAEKWNARKAALQMVGMQASAAGLLGLPAVGSGIAILNQLFPNLQLPQKTREGVSELLGGDHWSTDVAMGGLPSMLGWDLKSRLSMGNVVPGVDESQGFQPSQLLGAPLSLATKWITGAKSLAGGDPAGLVNLMPSGVKDVLKLAGADSPVSDARGRQLFQPPPGEAVGAALGFRSTRLSDVQTQERLSQQTSKVLNEQEGKWRQARAQDVVQGNFGSVRQALLQRVRDDPSYDAATAGRDIASAAETMSFPYDPTRVGNASTSAEQKRLLATFSLPTPPSNEVQRTQFRLGVLQRLGLNPGDVGSQMRQAQLEDQIKTSSPTLTRAQVQLAAQRTTSAPRAQPLLAEQQ